MSAAKWFSRGPRKDGLEPGEGESAAKGKPGAGDAVEDGLIVVLNGREAGKSFVVRPGARLTAGRSSECEIQVAEEGVSRRHFAVECRGGSFLISDLGSSNGTLVNGAPAQQFTLQDGDRIKAGPVELQFQRRPSFESGGGAPGPSLREETTIRRRIEEAQLGQGLPDRDDADRSRQMLRTLFRVGGIIHAESDGKKIFDTIIDAVFLAYRATRAFLLMYDPSTGLFERTAFRTSRGEKDDIGLSRTILLESVRKGLSVLSSDTKHDDRFRAGESVVMQNIRSAMCVPVEAKGEVIGALYVDNVSIKDAFVESDLEMLSAIGKQAGLAVMKIRLAEENARLFYNTVRTLVASIEAKDQYTGGHTERVAAYALQLAEEMGLPAEEVETLKLAGLLHDVGKIGIPEKILRKPGRLSEAEYEIMKKHPGIGAGIAGNIENIETVKAIVLHHHERWDGTGYPGGLKAADIPKGARILAVADAFDAMTSHRTYRRDFSPDEVLSEFRRCAGLQFDPEVVEAFLRASEKGRLVKPEVLPVNELIDSIPQD